jgi:FeS cluster assembly scaffold protein NifU
MKSTNYTEKVLDHFNNPRNAGTLEGPNVASGRVGNPTCGDIMEIYIDVDDEIIKDVKFKTFGCGSAVATSSMTTEMAKGMTLDDALKLTKKDVAEELEGLPPIKMHCSNLAADALHEAINNYKAGKRVGDGSTDDEIKPVSSAIDMNAQVNTIKGEMDYLGNGLSYSVKEYEEYDDERVLIVHNGDESITTAIELTKHTGRVILITSGKEISASADLKKKLQRSDVKILIESNLIEVMGEGEVEKVKIHDIDEDEDYELFVDKILILSNLKIASNCSD